MGICVVAKAKPDVQSVVLAAFDETKEAGHLLDIANQETPTSLEARK